jgi:4-aminobutyrate aminotransferase-like enzyme
MAIDTLVQYDDSDPIAVMAEVAAGFDRVLPLEADEVDHLFDAVLTRFAITAVIIAWRRAVTPDQPGYLREYQEPQQKILARLMEIGRDRARAELRHRLRFPPYCPPEEDKGRSDNIDELLARRRQTLGKHLSLFYERPIHMVRGRGAWLYDATGKAYIDAYNNVPVVGHCHPHVVRTLSRQASALNTNTRYIYEIVIEYAERLTASLPDHLTACTFVNSGSEANDIAWRMATLVTGKRGAIIMDDAYHGITEAIAHLSPHGPEDLAPHVRTLMAPDPYRGPYRAGEADLAERYAADADRAIAELDEAGLGTACFMIDTSYCSNGIPDVPEGYTRMVAEKVHAAGGLVVADEVQYGFGRPGTHMWGFRYHDVEADFVTMGKPIGNGIALGAVITTQEIMKEFGDATGLFSTFGGNPVACAAGLAVMDVLEQEDLIESARVTGEHLRAGLRGLMQRYPLIGDVRGHGLIAGVEIVKDRETREPAPDEMKQIMNRMKDLGVLTGREGHFGNVFKIRPPLAFKPDHADRLIEAMDQALAEI